MKESDPRRTWNSSKVKTERHSFGPVNMRYFETPEQAESYRQHRNARKNALKMGYPATYEGVESYLAWKRRQPVKGISAEAKIKAIKKLIERSDTSMTVFAHRVIDIVENR